MTRWTVLRARVKLAVSVLLGGQDEHLGQPFNVLLVSLLMRSAKENQLEIERLKAKIEEIRSERSRGAYR